MGRTEDISFGGSYIWNGRTKLHGREHMRFWWQGGETRKNMKWKKPDENVWGKTFSPESDGK